jgi:hypothetical protein
VDLKNEKANREREYKERIEEIKRAHAEAVDV